MTSNAVPRHKINNEVSYKVFRNKNDNGSSIEIPLIPDPILGITNLNGKIIASILRNEHLQYCLGTTQVDNNLISYEPIYDYDLDYAFSNNKINSQLHDIIILKVLCGLHILHQNGWIHNNIHPKNIYLFGDQVRLANFNKTTRINWAKPHMDKYDKYSAPEKDNISYKSDMWMLGCLIFKIKQGIDLFNQEYDSNYETPFNNLTNSDTDYEVQLAQWFDFTNQEHNININYDKNSVKPNIINKDNTFVNWNDNWTQIAYKYLLLSDSEKRYTTNDLLQLTFIKDKLQQHYINIDNNIYNSCDSHLFPKYFAEIKEKEQFYEQSLQYWQKSFDIKIDPQFTNLLYFIYHVSQPLQVDRKNKIILALYLTQKITQNHSTIPADKINADIINLETRLLTTLKFRLPIYL